MKIETIGIGLKLTDAMKDYIENKLQFLDKHLEEDSIVTVTCKCNNDKIKVKIIFCYKSEIVTALVEDDAKKFYDIFNDVLDKVKAILIKKIEKNNFYKPNSIKTSIFKNEDKREEIKNGKIVKRKLFNMKPMFEEEAILQMELLKHPTFFFFNAETETMCLLYKRKDGNYGLINSAFDEEF